MCGSVGITEIFTEVVRWPSVLLLGLKRWHWNVHRQVREKISRQISFETVLPCSDGKGSYALRSVFVHDGAVGSGHYTSRVRAGNNVWYEYDDIAQPKPQATEAVLKEKAYILVFER